MSGRADTDRQVAGRKSGCIADQHRIEFATLRH